MSALAFMKSEEKKELVACVRKSWKLLSDSAKALSEPEENVVNDFNGNEVVKKLAQLVGHEKSDFRPIINPGDLVRIISVVPRRTHARISAQRGGFLLYGLAKRTNDLNMPDVTAERFSIASDKKKSIIKDLRSIGIAEETLFPEIEKSALQIKSRYS